MSSHGHGAAAPGNEDTRINQGAVSRRQLLATGAAAAAIATLPTLAGESRASVAHRKAQPRDARQTSSDDSLL